MIEHYLVLKQLHITAAYASLAFFVLRAFWSVRGVSLLQARWVKVVPHVIDTLLLTLGVKGRSTQLLAATTLAYRQNHGACDLYFARHCRYQTW